MTDEQNYKQVLERAKNIYGASEDKDILRALETIFPELKEPEDERIKREIVDYLKGFIPHHDDELVAKSKVWIAWLEKQAERKPISEVNPKFKIGDWIVQGCNILKIRCVGDEYYCFETVGGYVDDMLVSEIDSLYHLWTIQDAKDGDVLMANAPFIFNGNLKDGIGCPGAHCGINTLGNVQLPKYSEHWTSHTATPATKEQRDLLFQKMHEAGYEWDAEHKQLKKIEQKPAWSEKDDRMLESILWHVSYSVSNGKETDIKCNLTDWLKSLKEKVQPQNTWKPSDEQMEALKDAVGLYKLTHFDSQHYKIESLYDNLKKLMEE